MKKIIYLPPTYTIRLANLLGIDYPNKPKPNDRNFAKLTIESHNSITYDDINQFVIDYNNGKIKEGGFIAITNEKGVVEDSFK